MRLIQLVYATGYVFVEKQEKCHILLLKRVSFLELCVTYSSILLLGLMSRLVIYFLFFFVFVFVPRLFEEKRRDTVFGFPWCVVPMF